MITKEQLEKLNVAYLLRMGDCINANDETDEIEELAFLGIWARDHETEIKYALKDCESFLCQNALSSYPKENP